MQLACGKARGEGCRFWHERAAYESIQDMLSDFFTSRTFKEFDAEHTGAMERLLKHKSIVREFY
eukprot:scaffold99186_cov13-Tisochrysis_lutea.AAC.1